MAPKKFKVCRLKVMTALRHSWQTSQHLYTNTNDVFVLTAFCIWYERHFRVRFCESDLSPMVSAVASAIRFVSLTLSADVCMFSECLCRFSRDLWLPVLQRSQRKRGKFICAHSNLSVHPVQLHVNGSRNILLAMQTALSEIVSFSNRRKKNWTYFKAF